MAECPVIALSDDDKIAAFFSSSDMEKCALLPVGCSASDLTCAASRLMLRRDEIAAHLHIETEKHREKAVTELERLNAFLANE
jgi:hypothetical protein